MKSLDSKLPTVGTTIFTVMSQLAEQHDAVNLSQGFPDFSPPAGLLERVERTLRGRYHQYAPMPGSTGVIAGFGPGITAEMAVGQWADESRDAKRRAPLSAAASA